MPPLVPRLPSSQNSHIAQGIDAAHFVADVVTCCRTRRINIGGCDRALLRVIQLRCSMANRWLYLRTMLSMLVVLSMQPSVHAQDHLGTVQQNLVVVELFQSQGCSSCPPAEENLNALADDSQVLALSFGVTYWDNLGWKDTFATPIIAIATRFGRHRFM
jgi:Protein of unknown function (DUF1223)